MTTHEPSHHVESPNGEQSQYLSFKLSGEEYAIDILRVQEIKGFSRVTPLPHSPPEVKGVMNLRGAVIPIVDLRIRFGMEYSEVSRFSVIIVVTVGTKIVGLVVDAVSDVLNIGRSEVAPPPEMGGGIDGSFMRGIARVGEKLVTIFNIENLVGKVTGGNAI